MTFEEFFKKKKINLALLQPAEPDLFMEFRSHYQLMGEKSFDHTKKYWFNLLRRKYHLPDEPKVEKLRIENPLAEQTITERVIEQPDVDVPKLGFKPKFKTAESKPEVVAPKATPQPEQPEQAPAEPKPAYKPRFQAGKTKPPPQDVG